MNRLRTLVLGWTLFTTTFLWTPTMRMFLKPEVSQWNLFGLSGTGPEGAFWVFPVGVLLALLLFYVEGRGRLRPVAHTLLLGWHLSVTGVFVFWSVRAGEEVVFKGGAWGWEVPLPVLSIPFVLFSLLAVTWVWREFRRGAQVESTGWFDVDWRLLVGALALLPVAVLFFRLGDGYDGPVRLAIIVNVIQWVLLALGLNGRRHVPATTPGTEPV